MRLVLVMAVGAMITGICAPAFCVVNSGFEMSIVEDGINVPLSWDRENYAAVVSSFSTDDASGNTDNWLLTSEQSLLPFQGESFVVLSTGDIPAEESTYATLTQLVEVQVDNIVSGVFFFGTCDYFYEGYNNDYATITLLAPEGSGLSDIEIVRISVEDVGDYSSTAGWISFESDVFTEENAGLYTLQIAVFDDGDELLNSYFAVDDIYIPEPAAILLISIGGILVSRRRR